MSWLRKNLAPSLGVLAALAGFAFAPAVPGGGADWARIGASVLGLLVVAIATLRGDEVERGLVFKACGAAFALSLCAAIAVAILGEPSAEIVARYAWAGLMAAWLVCWALLRMRLA